MVERISEKGFGYKPYISLGVEGCLRLLAIQEAKKEPIILPRLLVYLASEGEILRPIYQAKILSFIASGGEIPEVILQALLNQEHVFSEKQLQAAWVAMGEVPLALTKLKNRVITIFYAYDVFPPNEVIFDLLAVDHFREHYNCVPFNEISFENLRTFLRAEGWYRDEWQPLQEELKNLANEFDQEKIKARLELRKKILMQIKLYIPNLLKGEIKAIKSILIPFTGATDKRIRQPNNLVCTEKLFEPIQALLKKILTRIIRKRYPDEKYIFKSRVQPLRDQIEVAIRLEIEDYRLTFGF